MTNSSADNGASEGVRKSLSRRSSRVRTLTGLLLTLALSNIKYFSLTLESNSNRLWHTFLGAFPYRFVGKFY